MSRIAFTELLCVYCPEPARAAVWPRLRALHPQATCSALRSGWLVVESPVGEPISRWLGSSWPVRFAVGEEQLCATPDPTASAAIAKRAQNNPESLDELPGDFCLVVLGDRGTATAVRSCNGVPRLFVFSQSGVTAIGTRLEWVARVFPEPLCLDANRLASDDHALGVAPQDASAIAGIRIVPVGHAAHCGGWASPRLTRYWAPEQLPPLSLGRDQLVDELEQRLTHELAAHLDCRSANAVLYSGGLDSSLLTALSAPLAPIDGVTILPPLGHPALSRERYYARTLTHQFRQHVVHHMDPTWLLTAIAAQPGSLAAVASSEWQALDSLSAAPQAVVTGWFADEGFGRLRLPELFRHRLPRLGAWLAACSPREATETWYRRRRAGRAPFQTESLSPGPLFHPGATRDFQGWLRSASWMPRPEGRAERLVLHRRLTDIAGAYAEAAAIRGARAVAPFASRSVVELAARCAPEQLFAGRLPKAPLRALAERYLPTALSTRTDKGDWGLPPLVFPQPHLVPELAGVLDMDYLQAHPNLSLDEVGTLLWVATLERGRVRIEHDRQALWAR